MASYTPCQYNKNVHFVSSRYDPDIWLRIQTDLIGCDYIGTHMDDLMVVAKESGSHPEIVKAKFVQKIGASSFYLFCDRRHYKLGNNRLWCIGTETCIKEALVKAKSLLGCRELGKEYTPISHGAYPESDTLPLLDID